MILICEPYGSYCDLSEFKINGKEADYEDFGEKDDLCPEQADDYGCGNMRFIPKLPTQLILDKYQINVDEYKEICEQLEEKLSFGHCGWCI